MTEGTSLDSILSDEPTTAEVVTETVEETQLERPRDEHGRFAAKETGVQAEPQGEEPVPPTDQLPPETFKAVKEEREKRQNLERELEALRNQIQQAQNQQPPVPAPSLWEDEDGWQQHLQQQVLAQADQLSRINASEMAARSQYPDFQEKFDLFNQMAVQNPQLVQQAMADPHPWAKAYQIAQSHKTMQELGAVDVSDLEAKIREKVMAELQQGQTPVPQQNLPPSLSGERSVASRGGPAWTGPTSLDSLLR